MNFRPTKPATPDQLNDLKARLDQLPNHPLTVLAAVEAVIGPCHIGDGVFISAAPDEDGFHVKLELKF